MSSTETRASDPDEARTELEWGARSLTQGAAQKSEAVRRVVPVWMILVAALTIALGAAFVVAGLRGNADEDRHALLLLKDLESQSYKLSSLEWQAVAEGQLDTESAEQAQDARGRMSGAIDEIMRSEGTGEEEESARRVAGAFRTYDAALDEQFRLLANGRVEEAEVVDEERVDPSFEELSEARQEVVPLYSADALRTDRVANAGSAFTLLVAAGLVALLYWWYGRARRAAVSAVAEQKALRKSEELFRYQALHDPLTNLPNRALFMDRLQHALQRVSRKNGTLAVLFVDLDNFKVVNDSLGHKEGDRLLISVGRRLQECLRSGDTLARLGGDEFTVLLEEGAGTEEAAGVAERLAERLQAPFELQGQEVFVKASVGIVASTHDDRADPDDLLRRADAAMYEAKRRGKAGYTVFHPDMSSRVTERLRLEAEMNRAIERDEFRVHYQPLIELDTGRISEVEALVRWEHPKRGLLPPGEFLPLAEETGLILPIGRIVLREACRQVREWQEYYPSEPPLMLDANLSTRQFRQPDLVGEISGILEETGLEARSLRLEITESIAVDDVESAIVTLQELKEMGVALAIDDFGTGYSSLSYIKRFPIDVLKIARPFVDGLGRDDGDTALVRATIAFAKAFDLDVTGEGIETAEQLDRLRELGCDTGQGYYFAKPLPSDAAGKLFSEAKGR